MEPPEYVEEPSVPTSEAVPATPLSVQHTTPVTLTWTPNEVASTETPPGYASASIPMEPVLYTFSPLAFNSMILVPPADAQDSRPRYHISVSFNCFFPSRHITIVRRGGSDTGEHVADLEDGNSTSMSTVRMRGQESQVARLFTKQPKGRDKNYPHVFAWHSNVAGRSLLWQGDGITWKCTLKMQPDLLLARFLLPSLNPRSLSPTEPRRLEVTPDGHGRGEREGIFDEIIVSVLVLERKRIKAGGW